MFQHLIQFWKDEEGATAVEYALIVGLIAVVLIAALTTMGGKISDLFGFIGDELDGVHTPSGEGG